MLKSASNSKYPGLTEPSTERGLRKLNESEIFGRTDQGGKSLRSASNGLYLGLSPSRALLGPQGASSLFQGDPLPGCLGGPGLPRPATIRSHGKAYDLEPGRAGIRAPQRPGHVVPGGPGAPRAIKGLILDSAGSPTIPQGLTSSSLPRCRTGTRRFAEPGAWLRPEGLLDIAITRPRRAMLITQTADKGLYWSIHDLRLRKASEPEPPRACRRTSALESHGQP